MTASRWLAFPAGILFALGLALSGMVQPSKVFGFLDVTGRWDPSLAFVMIGAIGVHFVAHRVARRWQKPLLAASFDLPTLPEKIDGRLVVGSALFGLGWGLSGYCPGPALVSVACGALPAIVTAVSMLAGVALHEALFIPRTARSKEPVCGGADLA
jgi:uncharacterized membrane protein YedE/YeeE